MFVNAANVDKKVDRVSRIRAVWYVMLAALEDVETQRRGICLVVTFKNAKLSQVQHQNPLVMEDGSFCSICFTTRMMTVRCCTW